MRLEKIIATGVVLGGLIVLGGCGTSDSNSGTISTCSNITNNGDGTMTADLIKDYQVVQKCEELALGTPYISDDFNGTRFLLDFKYDNGLKTMIVTFNADGNGTARNAPSAENAYATNSTAPLSWAVDGNLTAVVGTDLYILDVLMIPMIPDATWVNENVLVEATNRAVASIETRHPAALNLTTDFDAAADYTANCASCHGADVPGDLNGFTADTLEVRMIRIKDDSDLTGIPSNMVDELDSYTVGELRLLAEYITTP